MVYTRWRNLKKTKSMEVGQVGFHDQAKVRKCKAEKNNAVVNALNRTKEVGASRGWGLSAFVYHGLGFFGYGLIDRRIDNLLHCAGLDPLIDTRRDADLLALTSPDDPYAQTFTTGAVS